MKIKIQMKNPDCVSEAIREAAESSAGEVQGVDESERESLVETRREALEEACEPWIEYGEYITVEIDTEAQTAVVCKVR